MRDPGPQRCGGCDGLIHGFSLWLCRRCDERYRQGELTMFGDPVPKQDQRAASDRV